MDMQATTEHQPPTKGLYVAYFVCWLLGNGCLFSWNSMLTIQDYYAAIFPHYHPTRALTLVYQPLALLTLSLLAYYEAQINTRVRILVGYTIFFTASIFIPLLDLGTSGHGGIGPFIGICIVSGLFGFAEAHTEGGMVGDLSFMHPQFLQSFFAGLAASGVATSALRIITKASFEDSTDGLRKGALTFFFISAFFCFMCILLYAFVFPRLEIVKYYRSKAAQQGSKTVKADLAAAGLSATEFGKDIEAHNVERLSTYQLLRQNMDFAVDIFLIYSITLSIFPGFLSEDTGSHKLGTWYAITLIALYNVGDLVGRYIPIIDKLKLKSRSCIMAGVFSRFLLIPCFYFTAKYGTAGWMMILCVILGLSNGYLTVCVMMTAPKGYRGPEQNALGNLLVLCLVCGIFAGVTLDWLWLIGKGW